MKWFPSGNIIGVNSRRQVRHWRLSSINVRCTYIHTWTMICKIVDIMVAFQSRLSENGHIKQLNQKEGVYNFIWVVLTVSHLKQSLTFLIILSKFHRILIFQELISPVQNYSQKALCGDSENRIIRDSDPLSFQMEHLRRRSA